MIAEQVSRPPRGIVVALESRQLFLRRLSINHRSFSRFRPIPSSTRSRARPFAVRSLSRACNGRAIFPSSFPPRAKGSDGQKQKSTYVRARGSALGRRGYYRQRGIERSQFPRGLRRVGHARCCCLSVARVHRCEYEYAEQGATCNIL